MLTLPLIMFILILDNNKIFNTSSTKIFDIKNLNKNLSMLYALFKFKLFVLFSRRSKNKEIIHLLSISFKDEFIEHLSSH